MVGFCRGGNMLGNHDDDDDDDDDDDCDWQWSFRPLPVQRVRSVPQDERDEQTAGKASKTSCKYHKYLQVPQLFVKKSKK